MGDEDRDFKARGRQLWGRRAGRELSEAELREIAENLSGFFKLLREWDAADRNRADSTAESQAPQRRAERGRRR
jgi:hypothetical protein